MELTRRRALRLAGVSATAVTAGCLSTRAPRNDDDGTDGGGADPTDDDTGDHPRFDDPPYDVDEPDCDPPGEGRDPLWLCANMAAEPSLPFEQVETRSPVLEGEGLSLDGEAGGAQFYVTLLTGEDHLDRVRRDEGGDAVELVESTSFDAEAVLVAQTGWGSGSVTPHLKRVEATDDGVHAFGCYRRPCVWTDDYSLRTVVARFDRPDALDSAVVSLTVDAETRVTVRADEGVVTVDRSL
jgi:hypothetical protein